jgi:hypothetical protein
MTSKSMTARERFAVALGIIISLRSENEAEPAGGPAGRVSGTARSTKMTEKWRCLPVVLCVLSLGCGGRKPEAPEKGGTGAVEKPAPAVAAPAAVAEAPKQPSISKFRLGSSFGPNDTVNAETRTFGPGEAVFASFEIPNAPAGSKARVSWALLPDKKPVSRQEAPLSPDKPAVAFKGDSKGWPIGDYEFQMSLVEAGKDDARLIGTATFKIVKDKPK